ncbi:MAG: CBASS oligonucleotide cyclase [Patescibacteria group bacterium]
MALTITASFQKFKENLQITGLQESAISTRQDNIRDAMSKELEVKSSFLTGSYRRDTMIAPLSKADIDIFVVLDPKYFARYNQGLNGGQAGLLDLVKAALKRTYPKTPDVSRNGQAVTVQFTDFVVDVVPGFERQGGGYLIPDSIRKNWISTNPKTHIELVKTANTFQNGNFVPIIKMIKAWNRNTGKFFSSFHLEMLALRVFEGVRISDFPSGMRYFFDKGRQYMDKQLADPAGYGGDVSMYINTQEKIDEAVNKFQLAYERAVKAESAAQRSNVSEAVEFWIKIFGDYYFPTYG